MNQKSKILTKEICMIILGSFIYSFAINYFFVANKLAEGGVAGISLMLHYLFHFEVSTVYIILNIPLVIVGFKFLGRDFILKTILSIILVTFFLKYTSKFGTLMDDVLLGSLFGGVMSGLGLGLVFMSGGSTGGIDILARIMTRYKGIPVGKALLVIDLFILSIVGILFGKIIFMYTLVAIFIASKVIDYVQEGVHVAKSVTVISNHSEKIKEHILDGMGRGVTILEAKGGYTGDEQKVIYCIMSKYEIFKFKSFVRDIDSNAFIVITDVSEVLGEGFKNINEQ